MLISKDLVKRRFSERASDWAASYSDPQSTSLNVKNLMARQRFVLQMIDESLPRGSKLLDLGCGPGEMSAKLMAAGYEVWGVDIAEPMVRHAQQRCRVDRFRVGDMEQIPFSDDTFDGVVCLGVIEYLEADAAALREIARVLKPGGRAIIATPSAVAPLHRLDRLLVALQPIFRFVKYRLRGRGAPPLASDGVAHRRYRRGRWLRELRSAGLQPEEWLCYGWGWYTSWLGSLVQRISNLTERTRRAFDGLFRGSPNVGTSLARSRVVNWLASEQLVRTRVLK